MHSCSQPGWRLAAVLFCALLAGCAGRQTVRIDPSGRGILTAGPVKMAPVPGKPGHKHRSGVVLTPVKVIAPPGSEVVMMAGVCGRNQFLLADQRVEWMLAPGGVGQFVEVGKAGSLDWLRLGDNFPRKVDNTFAIGFTSTRYIVLTRGTPMPTDDVPVLRGQAWITVTSPIEGTSHVTAYAPDVYGWGQRQQAGVIHWVDAAWAFPPPAVNPMGTRHVFSTVITRHSDRSPLADWRVRYRIVDGPPAGFAPDGAQVAEVSTDTFGQASVEIFQTQPQPGTNTIAIEVIRPPSLGDSGQRLVLGEGSTSKTWTAPRLALRKTGPAHGSVGATLSYRIEVSNPGEVPATDVVVVDQIPEGLAFSAARPEAAPQQNRLQWRFPQLGPGETQTIEVDMIAQRIGTVQNCASATAADGLTAQDCVTTSMLTPSLEVNVTGPERAEVGAEATFEIVVTNRGDAPASGIVLVNNFDEGLEHAVSASPIERDLGTLNPGESRRIGVTFRVARTGRLCTRVEAVAEGGLRALGEACLAAEPPPQPSLSVRKTGPSTQAVGGTAQFTIEVTNTGPSPLNDIRVLDSYDESLDPVLATEGYGFEDDSIVWRVTSLQPGQRATLQIHCRCLSPVARSCNRVTITTREGVGGQDEACLEIVEAAPTLSVSVAKSGDPVALGRVVQYIVHVTNNGQTAAQQVAIAATASDQLTIINEGTRGPSEFAIDGATVTFQPTATLGPGQTLVYEISARADREGDASLRVEATASGLATPQVDEETTRIFRQP